MERILSIRSIPVKLQHIRRARTATTKRTCSSMPRTLWRWIRKL